MFLSEEQRREYRKELIDPYIKKGLRGRQLPVNHFTKYLNSLYRFVSRSLSDLGIGLDYEVTAGEQTTAIGSIQRSRYGQMGSMGLHLVMRQQLRLEQRLQLSQELRLKISDVIDIEHCDDEEAAYIGAYSVMLHEIGHHIDWDDGGKTLDFMKIIDPEVLEPRSATEVICDRTAGLLSGAILNNRKPEKKQKLFAYSKLGLFHGFLVRLQKGLYDKHAESTITILLRMKAEFEIMMKAKSLGEETRTNISLALGYADKLIERLNEDVENYFNEEDLRKRCDAMKRVHRNIKASDVIPD